MHISTRARGPPPLLPYSYSSPTLSLSGGYLSSVKKGLKKAVKKPKKKPCCVSCTSVILQYIPRTNLLRQQRRPTVRPCERWSTIKYLRT